MPSRYYCPACGQVAGPDGQRHIATVQGARVAPHFLASAISSLLGEWEGGRALELCPGGPIDRVRDRAP